MRYGISVLLGMGLLAAVATLPAAGIAGSPPAATPAPGAPRDSDMQGARRELERGRSQLYAGRFDEARESFQRATKMAPANSSVAAEAAEHAEFRLPIARAHRRLLMGQRARAEVVLREALAANQAYPERVRQLNEMLTNLSALAQTEAEAQPLGLDNAVVVEAARGALESFRQRTGHYPVTSAELQRLMSTQKAPLDTFEVVRFAGDGSGYLLVLRNRNDPVHVITLQKTGLLR